jgi:hypothetical protein
MNSGAASPRSRGALRPVHWRWRIAIAGRRCEISKALRQRSSAIRFPACQRSIGENVRNLAQAFCHGRPSKGNRIAKKSDFKTLANQGIDKNLAGRARSHAVWRLVRVLRASARAPSAHAVEQQIEHGLAQLGGRGR